MANIPLKDIKFPGLEDTYTIPEVDATLTMTGAAADAKKVGDELTSVKQDLSEIVDIVGGEGESEVIIRSLNNSEFTRKSRFLFGADTAYPFFGSHRSFITYENFDIPVVYGEKYKIKVTVPSQYANDANMIVIAYNQTLVNAYNSQISANTSSNTNSSGGWSALEQTITIPNANNGDPCVGLLVSVRRSVNLPTIEDDFVITSVEISRITSSENGGTVVRYDIAQNKTEVEKAQARANLGITGSSNEYVTPQMYGAKGDGTTDDTAAFQAAINSGRNIFVPLSNGQRYLITDTLVFSKTRQTIFGDLYNLDWAYYAQSSLNGCIYFNGTNSVLFDFKQVFCGCANLSVFTNTNSNNIATRFLKNSDQTNTDGSVINCSFRNFDIAIDYYGRGLAVKRNAIIESRIAIKVTLMNDPMWDHSSPTNSEIYQGYPEYNGRSLFMTDNRFHLIAERYLQVISEDYTSGSTTIKQVLNGAIITNNMADLGFGSFEFSSPIKGCIFSHNEFLRISPDVFFDCQAGAYDCSIANNTIRGVIDDEYPQVDAYGKDCFVFYGLEYTNISGNIIENFKQRCISCYPDAFSHNVIIGNIFRKYGIDSTAYQYQKTGVDISDSEYSIITNNTFEGMSKFNGYLIKTRDVNTNVWKHNIFNGNTFVKQNASEVLVPTTSGTEDNIIQGVN